MSVKTAVSRHPDPRACARELRATLAGFDSRFITFFASARYDCAELGSALRHEFGDVPSLGCTTAGELEGSTQKVGSVVLLGMDADTVRSAYVERILDLRREEATLRAVDALALRAGTPAHRLDPERYLGMIIQDGLSMTEEAIMARIAALTNVPFVGGSAGDNLTFEGTTVFCNFEPYTGSTALALIEPVRPYEILKTQSFAVLKQTLEVTELEETTRTVHTFNGRPAAEELAAQIGVPLAELPRLFRKYAVGLVTREGEPFVRSAQRVHGKALVFYCQLKQGMRLNLLEAQDIVEGTRADLQRKLAAMGHCEAIVEFQCVNRTQELESHGQNRAYAELFAGIPTIGLATYGESYVGHMNQTSTLLLFR